MTAKSVQQPSTDEMEAYLRSKSVMEDPMAAFSSDLID
jgi:hypothetical protein